MAQISLTELRRKLEWARTQPDRQQLVGLLERFIAKRETANRRRSARASMRRLERAATRFLYG